MVIGISHNSRAKNGTVNNICHHIIRDIKVNRVHAYSNERTREFAPFLFRQFKFTAFDVRYVVRMNALKKVINAQSTGNFGVRCTRRGHRTRRYPFYILTRCLVPDLEDIIFDAIETAI